PFSKPATSFSIACGWSPAGEYDETRWKVPSVGGAGMWLSFIGRGGGLNPQCRATGWTGARVGKPYPRERCWRIAVHGACGQAAPVPKGIGIHANKSRRPDPPGADGDTRLGHA